MKKTLTLLLTLVMLLSCFAGLSLNVSAAELEYVEETYSYKSAMEDRYGNVDGCEENTTVGYYHSVEGFTFDDRWTYEYYDLTTKLFKPMTAYIDQQIAGYIPSYSKFYVPYGEQGLSSNDFSYNSIRSNGGTVHPGKTNGPVITFIVPASGKISYETAMYTNRTTAGVNITVWKNEEMIFPASGDIEETLISKNNSTKAEPFEVVIPTISVEEGDLIRLAFTTPDGKNNNAGTVITSLPVVTYLESSLPIGDPKGVSPTNIIPTRLGKDTSDTQVVWDAAKNAVSYNVYVKESEGDGDPVKVNADPITGLEYKITGLKNNTLYEVTVTSVTKDGNESVPSDPVGFLTPKGSATTSDTTSDVTSDTNTVTNLPATGSNVGSNNNTGDPAGFPWIIVVIAAVVVIAIVVVLVLVLGKKKAAAVPAAEESAEIAAPAEAPVEEAPAEETPSEEKEGNE